MFSQTVEYALRAMVQPASDSPQASTTKEIAEKTKVPSAYLAKVLQSMRRAGLIHSRRGVGGGVTLAHEPKSISLLEVIDAVEPLKRSGGKGRRATSPLQRTLDDALRAVRKTFAASSLADMLPGARRAKSAHRRRKARPARARKRPQ
jgi:Rrf2 family transcriptional regulator, nitric oxide-sensitive transcriptional repressor